MKIGIHHRKDSFSELWINYCKKKDIPFKIVNCYDSDIVNQLEDCDGLMWHWPLWDSKAILFARQLTYSLEESGKMVFPNSQTCWHYDDKLGQKYLFEALKIETIPTWAFYEKDKALDWIRSSDFPIVFKLRGGASSANVKLIKTKTKAKKIINKAFGEGFANTNKWNRLNDRILKFKRRKNPANFISILKGIVRLIVKKEHEKTRTRERGYVYFQKFIPGNDSDIRLVVVGSRCFGMRRYCRKDDFRASGSGISSYNMELIDTEAVETAFNLSKKLNMQSVAFDFIVEDMRYKLVEISYAFVSTSFPGYWNEDLEWHEGNISPQEVIVDDFIQSVSKLKK
ncbi:MAG: ATP-grasp domain-containing protein [bacterium]